MDVLQMVETGIYHEKVASQDNKYGIRDLNAKHKIYNLLGYELIDEYTIPSNSAYFDISNVDLELDKEHILELFLNGVRTSGDINLFLYPNNDQVTPIYTSVHYNVVGNGHGYFGVSTPVICLGSVSSGGMFSGKVTTKLQSAFYTSNSDINYYASSSLYGNIKASGQSLNYPLNVTSYRLLSTNGTFSGLIKAWKRLPLE